MRSTALELNLSNATALLATLPAEANELLNVVSSVYFVAIPDILGRSQTDEVMHAKYACCGFFRCERGYGVMQIARLLGERNHNTITNRILGHNNMIDLSKGYREKYGAVLSVMESKSLDKFH